MKKEVAYGIAGATGAAISAWRTMFPWLGDDLKVLSRSKKAANITISDLSNSIFLIDKFEATVKKKPDKTFIIYEDRHYTYRLINEYANKVANMFTAQGLRFGVAVALYCYNSPQFIFSFFGLLKIGVIVAMINTSLHPKALSYSVNASDAKAIIVGEGDLLDIALEAVDGMSGIKVFVQGLKEQQLPHQEFISFDDLLVYASPAAVDRSVRSETTPFSTCCYIYTSGTTGMPKPVHIRQFKAHSVSTSYHYVQMTENEVFMCVLPLFHSAAGFLHWSCVHSGGTLVLKKKFSASEFWQDVHKYKVTMFQYIGELCRYLLSRPPSALDTGHNIKAFFGNGLRKDIWMKFQSRFKIPLICEIFGATEGNTLMFQVSNKPGAVGRLSPYTRMIEEFPRRLVKYDFNTAEPVRDKNGRCIEVKTGEAGIFLSGIDPLVKDLPIYKASEEANNKKIVRNAFVDGDLYFNFGDLLYLDKDYFLYFSDRIGDTFRWKGENVSTTEVSNSLTDVDFIQDANVYGVIIPGQDGRAGMAAINLTTDQPITPQQLKQIFEHCENELPSYAVPRFIRHLKDAVLTVTFKQKKVDFVNEGFDPSVITDPLYVLNVIRRTYVPITHDIYPSILTSKL